MKNLLTITCFIAITYLSGYSQVFNTSATLKPGSFSFGIEPGLYVNGSAKPVVYFHATAGIIRGVDFGLKCGIGEYTTYIGGDVEFSLNKYFSLSGGAHSWGDFGLDATALLTLPLTKGVKLYTGGDSDIIFTDDRTYVPVWIPVGIDISIKRNIYFVFESEINITDDMPHFLGGGINLIF